MKAFFTLLPLCIVLSSSASPLGDRALFSRHSGVPLTRRYYLSSNFDIPTSCVPRGMSESFPDFSNATDSIIPDANSTILEPPSDDNSTSVELPSDDEPTVDEPVDANSTSSDNSTIARRGWEVGYNEFQASWFDLCSTSYDDGYFDDFDTCFSWGLRGEDVLFADADVCAQQHFADDMITFVKSRGFHGWQRFVDLAVSFRRLPRESVELFGYYPGSPYCQEIPLNVELFGVWQRQSDIVTVGLFGGPNYPVAPFGGLESCPFGQFANVVTCECSSSLYHANAGYPGTPSLNSTSVSVAEPEETGAAEGDNTESDDTEGDDTKDDETEEVTSAAASSVAATSAPGPSATAELSGDVTDPNGRRRRAVIF